MEEKILPPNLHYNNPNPEIPGLTDGSLQVVDECTKWNGGLVAMNSFGFGGANVHAIYKLVTNFKNSISILVRYLKYNCVREP